MIADGDGALRVRAACGSGDGGRAMTRCKWMDGQPLTSGATFSLSAVGMWRVGEAADEGVWLELDLGLQCLHEI